MCRTLQNGAGLLQVLLLYGMVFSRLVCSAPPWRLRCAGSFWQPPTCPSLSRSRGALCHPTPTSWAGIQRGNMDCASRGPGLWKWPSRAGGQNRSSPPPPLPGFVGGPTALPRPEPHQLIPAWLPGDAVPAPRAETLPPTRSSPSLGLASASAKVHRSPGIPGAHWKGLFRAWPSLLPSL